MKVPRKNNKKEDVSRPSEYGLRAASFRIWLPYPGSVVLLITNHSFFLETLNFLSRPAISLVGFPDPVYMILTKIGKKAQSEIITNT